MPLTRSREDLSNIGEATNVSFTVDLGTENTIQTRSQTGARAKNIPQPDNPRGNYNDGDNRIQRLISNSLDSFREEMISVISNQLSTAMRNINLTNSSNSNQSNNRSNTPNSNSENSVDPFYAEKVLNIIRNWKIKFTGHNDTISVDEFVYRINVLTSNTLRGDFSLLSKHAHTLFEGKALEWYWRYHRQNNDIDWVSLTQALRKQYKTDYNDFDILEDIRKRKQKSSESFDEYFEFISAMLDGLKTPISDIDLVETILRNLKLEIRHELLHLNISNVCELRREVRKHEKFMKDLHTLDRGKPVKGKITELLVQESLDNDICAIQTIPNCWNCDKTGHTYTDCMEVRRVFCYGCGLKDTYKPTCPKCKSRSPGNGFQDVRRK